MTADPCAPIPPARAIAYERAVPRHHVPPMRAIHPMHHASHHARRHAVGIPAQGCEASRWIAGDLPRVLARLPRVLARLPRVLARLGVAGLGGAAAGTGLLREMIGPPPPFAGSPDGPAGGFDAPANVPEPSAALVLGFAFLAVALLRRLQIPVSRE